MRRVVTIRVPRVMPRPGSVVRRGVGATYDRIDGEPVDLPVYYGNDPILEPGPNCYATNFMGPIPPGSVYCNSPVLPDPTNGGNPCPGGYLVDGVCQMTPGGVMSGGGSVSSDSTIFAGVPNKAVYAMGGILAFFLLMGLRR